MRKALIATAAVLVAAFLFPGAAYARDYRALSKPRDTKSTVADLKARGFRVHVQGSGKTAVSVIPSTSWADSWRWDKSGKMRLYPSNALVIVKTRMSDKDTVRARLEYWARKYGIRDRKWLVAKGMHIAYGESRYSPSCVTGSHVGVWQMTPQWGSVKQRRDIDWSTRRFVKAYMEGGRANLIKHWGATYY